MLDFKFVIFTDNVANIYFLTQKKLSSKRDSWHIFLPEFDFNMKYKPESANTMADGVSDNQSA